MPSVYDKASFLYKLNSIWELLLGGKEFTIQYLPPPPTPPKKKKKKILFKLIEIHLFIILLHKVVKVFYRYLVFMD